MTNIIKTEHQLDVRRRFEKVAERSELQNWLINQKSENTRRVYLNSIIDFFQNQQFENLDHLYKATHAHVIDYKHGLEQLGKSALTINTRLSAISSLFKFLVEKRVSDFNPARDVSRLNQEYDTVKSLSITKEQARLIIDAPLTAKRISEHQKLRDRAILALFFYSGTRITAITKLKVKDLFMDKGYHVIDLQIKGKRRIRKPISPEAASYIHEYLAFSGHANDPNELLFKTLENYSKHPNKKIPNISSVQIRRLWNKYSKQVGLFGYTPHSARSTHITEALENGCPIEMVATSVGHRNIATTKKYDQRTANHREASGMYVRF